MKKLIKSMIITTLATLLLFGSTLPGLSAQAQEAVSIAIVQLVSHPSLDDIVTGIYEGLEEAGYTEGDNLTVDFQNAEGDLNLLSTISQQVVSQEPDLIFAVTTPVAQAIQNATDTIPIIMAGVTDPLAANIVDDIEQPGGNITGASDKVSHESQFELIQGIMPELATIGLIYTTSEDNSENEMKEAQAVAEALGYEVRLEGISSALDIPMVAENLAQEVDAIYVGSDNTIASSIGNLLDITDQAGIPVFATVDNFVIEGALSAVAINQKDTGLLAAREAVKVLDGANPGDLPIAYLEDLQKLVNYEAAERLGIEIPAELGEEVLDIQEYQSEE